MGFRGTFGVGASGADEALLLRCWISAASADPIAAWRDRLMMATRGSARQRYGLLAVEIERCQIVRLIAEGVRGSSRRNGSFGAAEVRERRGRDVDGEHRQGAKRSG